MGVFKFLGFGSDHLFSQDLIFRPFRKKMAKTDFRNLSPEDVGVALILKKGSKTEGKIDPK